MGEKKVRSSNLEVLRIICILFIIGDHFTGQAGLAECGSYVVAFFYCAIISLSRVACSVFVIISAWFSTDQSFKFKKIIHIWLTVIMYTVPLMLYLYFSGHIERNQLIVAFFPVEKSPLWFAGYFIVLLLFMPLLNLLINNAHQKILEYYLMVMFILQTLYTSITTDLGFFSNDIWTLINIYLFVGYIKKYHDTFLNQKNIKKVSFAIFLLVWFLLTLLRTISWKYNLGILGSYCELYRARLQTLPNLVLAFSLFFFFKNIKMKNSQMVNKLATATLGVYCFHQVPEWYSYLWEHGFKSSYYSQVLHGGRRVAYTLICILLVWVIGTVIELARLWVSNVLIESRNYCKKLCCAVDDFVNKGNVDKKLWIFLVIIIGYFSLFKAYSLGMFDQLINIGKLTTAEDITSQVDIAIEIEDITYNGEMIECEVNITNNGKTICDPSEGNNKINLGISLMDSERSIIDQDYMHIDIKNGPFRRGENVEKKLILKNVEDNNIIRFEIVQEGIAWIDRTAVYLKR